MFKYLQSYIKLTKLLCGFDGCMGGFDGCMVTITAKKQQLTGCLLQMTEHDIKML